MTLGLRPPEMESRATRLTVAPALVGGAPSLGQDWGVLPMCFQLSAFEVALDIYL